MKFINHRPKGTSRLAGTDNISGIINQLDGFCVCGEELLPGLNVCQFCLNRRTEKKPGMCVTCRDNEAVPNKTICAKCASQQAAYDATPQRRLSRAMFNRKHREAVGPWLNARDRLRRLRKRFAQMLAP